MAAGFSAAFQGAANGMLSQKTGLGPALVFNSAVVLIATIILYLAQGSKGPWFPAQTPWVLYLGGVFGFIIIACLAFVFPKIGAGNAVALMVLGQGLAAVFIDHFGWFGMPSRPVDWVRLTGIGFLVAGVLLVRR